MQTRGKDKLFSHGNVYLPHEQVRVKSAIGALLIAAGTPIMALVTVPEKDSPAFFLDFIDIPAPLA